MAHMWGKWLHHPCLLRDPQCLARGKNQKWPTSGHSGNITPVFSWVPNAQHGEKIRNGPQLGTVATSPLPSRGFPNAHHGEKIRNGPQGGTVATSPVPSRGNTMPSTGRKSERAHNWEQCLHHPCLLGDPQCPARGENQKWPTTRHSGYITPAFSGIPNAQQREKLRNGPHVGKVATSPLPSRGSPMPSTGRKSEMAHKWAQWLHHLYLLVGSQCPAWGENQKWPTSGHSGYITPVFSGIPNAQHGEKIRNGPHVGKVATSPVPSRGSPMPSTGRKSERAHNWEQWLHHPCLLGAPQCPARGENQKWPTTRHSGCITPAFSGVPNAEHEEKIRNGPHVGTLTTSPLPSRGSPMLSTGRK